MTEIRLAEREVATVTNEVPVTPLVLRNEATVAAVSTLSKNAQAVEAAPADVVMQEEEEEDEVVVVD